MKDKLKHIAYTVILSLTAGVLLAQEIASDLKYAEAELILRKADGFKGIWYMNQP
jgi:hypothetical protein